MPISAPRSESLELTPLSRAPQLRLRVPGSKSLTNRALLCAALAPGVSTLRGALVADDTEAMLDAVRRLGAVVTADPGDGTLTVTGADPRRRAAGVRVDARHSGTTSRFVLPVLGLIPAASELDGGAQLRSRPFGDLISALRQLGAGVSEHADLGRLPLTVSGPLVGGRVELPGHVSSQFLSGLLIAGPLMPEGLQVELTSPPVSVPYLQMTAAVMALFGAVVTPWAVPAGGAGYRPADLAIEADASAASYFFAAAAITGGRVTVIGLDRSSLQGDLGFVDVLDRMGARVEYGPGEVTVAGTGTLHGVDVDLADLSDTAQTLAAVAVFADSPSRVRGIGFIRAKETDRIGAMVAELRRAGIGAEEHPDGFGVVPGRPSPTEFATYGDHRMAMSLSLLGLRVPGIRIADPGCVAKTYPGFFADLARLAGN